MLRFLSLCRDLLFVLGEHVKEGLNNHGLIFSPRFLSLWESEAAALRETPGIERLLEAYTCRVIGSRTQTFEDHISLSGRSVWKLVYWSRSSF